jgi:hypothetical protein
MDPTNSLVAAIVCASKKFETGPEYEMGSAIKMRKSLFSSGGSHEIGALSM